MRLSKSARSYFYLETPVSVLGHLMDIQRFILRVLNYLLKIWLPR